MCDVWGLIHQGDFKPEGQVDVERALRDWLVENGRDAAESTVRLKAGKLFRAYNMDVKDFRQP